MVTAVWRHISEEYSSNNGPHFFCSLIWWSRKKTLSLFLKRTLQSVLLACGQYCFSYWHWSFLDVQSRSIFTFFIHSVQCIDFEHHSPLYRDFFFQNSPIFKIRFPALHGKYKEWGLYRTQKWIPLISSFFSPDLFQCRKEEDLFVFQHFLFSFFHQRVIFQAFPLTNGILCCQKASKWLALFADNFYLAICNLISRIDMRTQFNWMGFGDKFWQPWIFPISTKCMLGGLQSRERTILYHFSSKNFWLLFYS